MLKIVFFNVGHGDSIAIKFPDDSWGIIDCQKNSEEEEPNVLKYLKKNGVESLRFVCITHPHDDHTRGVHKVIEHYGDKIGQYITYGPRTGAKLEENCNSDLYKFLKSLMECIKNKRSQKVCIAQEELIKAARRGNFVKVDETLEIQLLNPTEDNIFGLKGCVSMPDYNEFSVVMLINYKNTRILFSGDLPLSKWNEILPLINDADIDLNIYKVSHHGSKKSNDKKVIAALSQKAKNNYAIISSDGGCRYSNLPDPQVIETLQKSKFKIYSTENLSASSKDPIDISREKSLAASALVEETSPPSISLKRYDGAFVFLVKEDNSISIEELERV